MTLFKGSGVALVISFKNGLVNYEKIQELIEWYIENKTDAIIICGTTGEASTMTKDEKKEAIRFTIEKVNGRIPVIAGTGGNNTADVIEMSKYAQEVGADGLLIVTPYYNKTTQKGLIAHYTAVADEVNIPIIVYNVPGRTGLNILPKTVAELSKHPNIVGLKEACGDISQIADVARLCPQDFAIYSGNDDQVVPILSLGGLGVISVIANIMPKETHDMVYRYLEGDIGESRKIQLNMNGLVHSLFIETSPIPVKTAMRLLGMDSGEVRLPLVEMESKNKDILISEMKAIGLNPVEE